MLGGGKNGRPSRAMSLPVKRGSKGEGPKPRSSRNLMDAQAETEMPLRREGLERSSSHSKLMRLRQRQRRSRSPTEESFVPRRQSSMRNLKHRSNSPAASPVPKRQSSIRLLKHRSKSPPASPVPRRQGSMIDLKQRSKSPHASPVAKRQSSMRNLKHRSTSPPVSPVAKRPISMRSVTQLSKSPPISPASKRPGSVRSTKQRSKSPVVRKQDLVPAPPMATASASEPLTKLPKKAPRLKSPKGTHKGHKPKSPRTPKKPAVSLPEDDDLISPYPGLENSFPRTSRGELSGDTKIALDDASMPSLVDDSVVRYTMEAERGGKQWNIMEDAPAGHAEEKLVIVSAIENDDQSGDWAIDDSVFLDEDDDINEYEDEHSVAAARARGLNSLPTDPSSANGASGQLVVNADHDRFAPAFNNRDRWKYSTKGGKEAPAVVPSTSADVSLVSDTHEEEDLESSSELGNYTFEDETEKNALAPDDDDGDCGNSRTPATAKRSGGTRSGRMQAAPDLEAESMAKDSMADSAAEHQSLVNGPQRKSSTTRRAKKSPSSASSTGRNEKSSESTGRSSQQQSAHRPRKVRDALHSRKHKKVPDAVPTSMSSVVGSPMSSSLTSFANTISPTISSRSFQQQQSLKALQRHHGKNPHSSSKQRPNNSLNQHVEGGRDRFRGHEKDDDTLGASTISTNFTTTQRTSGDTTVSERSLFRSDKMGSSQIPRIPQRHSEGSDSEDGDIHGGNLPQQAIRTTDDHASNIQDAARAAENLFSGNIAGGKPQSSKGLRNAFLRPPSGGDDDLLAMVDSTVLDNTIQSVSTSEDFSLGSSEQQVDGAPPTKAFLQLNPSDHGVVVESEVVDSKTGELHVETILELDAVATQSGSGCAGVNSSEQSEPNKSAVGGGWQTLEKVKGEPVVDLSARIYGMGAPGSPDSPSKKKKKSRLALFKKMTSWKGKVTLDDKEEDK